MINTFSSREKLGPQNQKSPDLIFAQKRDEVRGASSSGQANSSSSGLRVVHATNGRIRLRSIDEEANSKLDGICQILQQCMGVTSVDVNCKTGSLILYFDKNILSLKRVLAILQELGIERQDTLDAVESKDPFAPWKSLGFWKEQTIDLIPLFTGLAVTSRLGVSGLAAIPVYFVAANAMRKVIALLSEANLEESNYQRTSTKPYADSASKIHKTPGLGTSKVERTSTITEERTVPPAVADNFPKTEKIEYSVAHAIPGRIRLNIPRIAEDSAYARRLERLLKGDKRVTNVRIKTNIASVTINHSERKLPISHWLDLMQSALLVESVSSSKDAKTVSSQKSSKSLNIQIENKSNIQHSEKPLQIEYSTEIHSTENPESSLQVSSLWANMKAPGLSYSLAVMANLPLN